MSPIGAELPLTCLSDYPGPLLSDGAVAFRPEAVCLSSEGGLRGTVRFFHTLGPTSYGYLDMGPHAICRVVPRHVPLHAGEHVIIDVLPEAVHRSDRAIGSRLVA